MLLIPYFVDVPMYRWPIANFALIGGTVLMSFLAPVILGSAAIHLILHGFAPLGLLGHMFLHIDIWHLLGNMIFLWTFGNAICNKVGNAVFVPLYLFLGLCSAVMHNLFGGGPAVGASGAINGLVGMYLIWYVANPMKMFYWIWVRAGTFRIDSYWMILLWVLFDIYGIVFGSQGVAVWGHLGGFIGGAALGVVLLLTGLVQMNEHEESLLQMFGIGSGSPRPIKRKRAPREPLAEPEAPAALPLAVTTPAAPVAPHAPRTTLSYGTAPAVAMAGGAGLAPPVPPAPPVPDAAPAPPTPVPEVEPPPPAETAGPLARLGVEPRPPSGEFTTIRCQCARQLVAPETLRGRWVRCPRCGHVVQIPR